MTVARSELVDVELTSCGWKNGWRSFPVVSPSVHEVPQRAAGAKASIGRNGAKGIAEVRRA